MSGRRVLFVCTGNICRSPTAEAVARRLANDAGIGYLFDFDSAATHAYHVGEPPDPRTVAAAARRGYDLSAMRARRVGELDFQRFDRILAMDFGHLDILRRQCPGDRRDRLGLFLDYAERFSEREMPDPYYGGADGFEHVLDLAEDAVRGLLKVLAPK